MRWTYARDGTRRSTRQVSWDMGVWHGNKDVRVEQGQGVGAHCWKCQGQVRTRDVQARPCMIDRHVWMHNEWVSAKPSQVSKRTIDTQHMHAVHARRLIYAKMRGAQRLILCGCEFHFRMIDIKVTILGTSNHFTFITSPI